MNNYFTHTSTSFIMTVHKKKKNVDINSRFYSQFIKLIKEEN